YEVPLRRGSAFSVDRFLHSAASSRPRVPTDGTHRIRLAACAPSRQDSYAKYRKHHAREPWRASGLRLVVRRSERQRPLKSSPDRPFVTVLEPSSSPAGRKVKCISHHRHICPTSASSRLVHLSAG